MKTYFINGLSKEQFEAGLTKAIENNKQKGFLYFLEFQGDNFKLGKKGLLTKRNSGLFTLVGLVREEADGLRVATSYKVTPRVLDLLTLFLLVFMYFRYSNKLVVAVWALLFILLGASEFFTQNRLNQSLIKQFPGLKEV